MPAAIIPFAAAVAGWITWEAFVVSLVLAAVGTWQASRARRAARDAYNASLKDRLVSVSTTTGYRSRVYGRVRNVDGVLFKATHGADSSLYTFVVAVAGHEVDGIETAYFNDIKLTLDGSGYVQTAPYALTRYEAKSQSGSSPQTLAFAPVSGSVVVSGVDGEGHPAPAILVSVVGSVVTFSPGSTVGAVLVSYQTATLVPKARVRFYNGAPGQDLSSDLVALGVPGITAGVHRFEGIACMLITLTYDIDAFATGVPQFTATLRGAKCLDRRTSTTAFSQNPAVIADDWARYPYGGNLALDEVASDLVIASANACDVSHNFVVGYWVGATVISTMNIYLCGIVCKTEADPSQTMSAIVEAMAGEWGWASGQLRIKGGFYSAPVATIDETWISDKGSRVLNQGLPQNELVNVYMPQLADGDHDYLVVPAAPVRADAYITADGRELPVSIQLEGVTDVVHAQHVCGVMLRRARQGFSMSLPCNFRGLALELFDTVAVTLPRFGLSAKVMEVVSWSFAQDSGTQLLLRETSAGIFDPDAGFKLLDESPNTGLPLPWSVSAPFNLTVSSVASVSGDSIVTKTRVEWDLATDASVLQSGDVEVQYVNVVSAPSDPLIDWPSQRAKASAGELEIVGLVTGEIYLFRARAINPIGVRSRWSVQTAHLIEAPPAIDVGIMFRVIAKGNDDTSMPMSAGLYRNGVQIGAAARSYMIDIIDRATGDVLPPVGGQSIFDVYGTPGDGALLAAAVNALDSSVIVVVRSFGEPYTNRLLDGIPAALYRCGASHTVFESKRFAVQGAYVLIGIPNCGEGNGYEAMVDYSVPTRTFCDVSFVVRTDGFIVSGTGATPLAVTDLNYVGTADMQSNAATEIVQDNHDFAGATFGGSGFNTQRTVVVTPAADCVVEFTADIGAARIDGDSGSSIRWLVTPAGGSAVLLGGSASQTSLIQRHFASNAFLATAGIALTFELQTNRGGFTNVALYDSHMRITMVKR